MADTERMGLDCRLWYWDGRQGLSSGRERLTFGVQPYASGKHTEFVTMRLKRVYLVKCRRSCCKRAAVLVFENISP